MQNQNYIQALLDFLSHFDTYLSLDSIKQYLAKKWKLKVGTKKDQHCQIYRHPEDPRYLHNTFLFCFAILTIVLNSASCTFKSRSVETPIPSDQEVSKSFFITSHLNEANGKTIVEPKTFLCGWASEVETGSTAENSFGNNVLIPTHCNLVFEITENKLLGKLINPSFPNDPNRWEIVMTIPIVSHYYYEAEKDDSGRETKRMIKNSSRSHWSARPQMELQLEGIDFQTKWATERFFGNESSTGNINVENVEWDASNGFLGFTLNRGSYGSHYNKIRFNIKEFKSNPKFKVTAFNEQNAKYMNVLHIVGEKVNGLYPILYAAHWDLNKTHELYMCKVPEHYKALVQEVVDSWNKTLIQIGATNTPPFVLHEKEPEHCFDLRHSSITWVQDEKISSYSPLGVGMALADVKNGEIQWGMISLYGGMIEKYMKAFSSGESSDQSASRKLQNQFLSKFPLPLSLQLPTEMQQLSLVSPLTMVQTMAQTMTQSIPQTTTLTTAQTITKTQTFETHLKSVFAQGIQLAQDKTHQVQTQLSSQTFLKLLNTDLKADQDEDNSRRKNVNPDKLQMDYASRLQDKYYSPHFCLDRTISDVAAGWAQVRAENAQKGMGNDSVVLRRIIKELIIHEYGHLLGLGHQFKENILPTKGEVPDEIYQRLAALSKPEHTFTNYSSVMGYRHPRSEMAEQADIKPGPQDELVLRYLYRQQYATFKSGDSDFTFFDLPKNGLIPKMKSDQPEYKASYFPNCNDIDASLALDPFCNRFDQGSDPVSIVQSYFVDLKDNLLQHLFTFTDSRGSCPECAEGQLYMKSFSVFSRVRLFYDYMRVAYKDELSRIRGDEESLFDFSTACREQNVKNETLRKIFAEKPELKELCQANLVVLDEMKSFVSKNLTDFTIKDTTKRFTPGGLYGGDSDKDWSRAFGSWTELTGLPLKLASLFALHTGVPWMTDFGFAPVPLYNDPHQKFSYSSLFPREYTEIIASNVRNNLKFAGFGPSERTSMGRSVLSMSWLNELGQYDNNDAALFPPQYIEKIRNPQNFHLSLVAILLKGHKKENNPLYVDSFNGQVFDMAVGKSTPVTSVYLLPGGVVIARAPGMFLFPLTRFVPGGDTDTEGYIFAYKLEYATDPTNPLAKYSVQTDLKDLHDGLFNACVMGPEGANNGLSNYFSSMNSEFKGFQMGTNIAKNETQRKEFLDSIENAYKTYYKSPKFSLQPKPETCREAIRGLGLIISSAAILSGTWLPEIMDYIQK